MRHDPPTAHVAGRPRTKEARAALRDVVARLELRVIPSILGADMPVDVLVICSKFARRALRGEWDAFFRHRGLVIVIWPTGQYTYQYRPTPLDDLPPVSSKKATDDAPAPDSPKSAEPLKVAPPVLPENPPTSTVSLDSRAYPSVVMPIQPQRRQAVS